MPLTGADLYARPDPGLYPNFNSMGAAGGRRHMPCQKATGNISKPHRFRQAQEDIDLKSVGD